MKLQQSKDPGGSHIELLQGRGIFKLHFASYLHRMTDQYVDLRDYPGLSPLIRGLGKFNENKRTPSPQESFKGLLDHLALNNGLIGARINYRTSSFL